MNYYYSALYHMPVYPKYKEKKNNPKWEIIGLSITNK